MKFFTIIFGFKNRDTIRIKNCLDSLKRQTFTDFNVIFVDYGSDEALAKDVKSIVETYDFCTYVYSDSRGYPWNRSRALNTGIRLAQGEYVVTTDIDMVYARDFFEILSTKVSEDRAIFTNFYNMPKKFNNWQNVEKYENKYHKTKSAWGACQAVKGDKLKSIGAFDEYFRYWGAEDNDIMRRLKNLGLKIEWFEERTMFHQWHETANHLTPGFMSNSFWGNMRLYLEKNNGNLKRDVDGFGKIIETKDREIFNYIDLKNQKLIQGKDIKIFTVRADDNSAIAKFIDEFFKVPSGSAIAVDHAFYPNMKKTFNFFFFYLNLFLKKAGFNCSFGYKENVLHSYLAGFIADNEDMIEDYYINFPALNGVTILIKK